MTAGYNCFWGTRDVCCAVKQQLASKCDSNKQ